MRKPLRIVSWTVHTVSVPGLEGADVAGADLDPAAVPLDRRPALEDHEGLVGLDVGELPGRAAPYARLAAVGRGREDMGRGLGLALEHLLGVERVRFELGGGGGDRRDRLSHR